MSFGQDEERKAILWAITFQDYFRFASAGDFRREQPKIGRSLVAMARRSQMSNVVPEQNM